MPLVLCDFTARTAGRVPTFYLRSQFSAFVDEVSIRQTTKKCLIHALRNSSCLLEWETKLILRSWAVRSYALSSYWAAVGA